MTKLTDDGLETNDPVVKSCFIGHSVMRPTLPPVTLQSPDGIDPKALFRLECVCINETHPILIPAATVAEVCGFPTSGIMSKEQTLAFTAVIISAGRLDVEAIAWLDAHTTKEA